MKKSIIFNGIRFGLWQSLAVVLYYKGMQLGSTYTSLFALVFASAFAGIILLEAVSKWSDHDRKN